MTESDQNVPEVRADGTGGIYMKLAAGGWLHVRPDGSTLRNSIPWLGGDLLTIADPASLRLAEFARWLLTLDDPADENGRADRQVVTLTGIIEQARQALGDDETVPPTESAVWADPHVAATDEMGADLYLTPRGEIGRHLVRDDNETERLLSRLIGPVPEDWRRLYVEVPVADDNNREKD